MTTAYLIAIIYLSAGLLCWGLQRAFDPDAMKDGVADKPRKLGETLGPVACTLIYLALAPILLPFVVWRIITKNRRDKNR